MKNSESNVQSLNLMPLGITKLNWNRKPWMSLQRFCNPVGILCRNFLKVLSLKSKVALTRMLIMLASVVVGSSSCFAQTTNAPAKLSYDSFRTISDRNIFNPSRYARGSGRTTQRTSSTPASRVESFSLVGIMAYDKGVFAFFDGTKPDHKKALQTDGAIGDFKIVHLTNTEVKIVAGTNTFDLKVGMQMRREDEGDWFLSESSDTSKRRIVSSRTKTRGSHNGSTESGGEAPSAGGEPEIIYVENVTESPSPDGEAAPTTSDTATSAAESSSTGNPVLDRLMKQAEALRNQ